jgi:hypothetical protein
MALMKLLRPSSPALLRLIDNCRRTGQCLEAAELPVAAGDRGVGERAELADVSAHPWGSMVDAAV